MRSYRGISLLEVLIVVAIVGILLGLGAMALQRYTARVELRHAQQTVVQTINQARTESRKSSRNSVVSWTTSTVSWTKTHNGNPAVVNTPLSDSGQVRITSGNGTMTYEGPNGKRNPGTSVVINLEGRFGLQASVRVIGVAGKAFAE
jgi:prepilin-type N-terminal cleavage/methylation domain-containing protein